MTKIGLLLSFTLLIGSSHGLNCIECNSSNIPDCATAPSKVNATCEGNHCFSTQIEKTMEVFRGCFGSGSNSNMCQLPNCKVCEQERCNLEAYLIGNNLYSIRNDS